MRGKWSKMMSKLPYIARGDPAIGTVPALADNAEWTSHHHDNHAGRYSRSDKGIKSRVREVRTCRHYGDHDTHTGTHPSHLSTRLGRLHFGSCEGGALSVIMSITGPRETNGSLRNI